ncbi:MAG: dockerin type I domain-containing protein [Ignavibacteria bacterium]|nr:dockerin type I domain-containing protein [Ignavibacteria bacterium]
MKKSIIYFLSAFIFILFSTDAISQVSGTKTIPSTNYPTIASAFDSLNAFGVGSGGVTFNVLAGHTETAANLVLSASGTSSNQIVFIKSGAGTNPTITAGTGVGSLDGIIKLNGADYVTFNGLTLQESTLNTTTTTQMEWGFALLKVDGTNGCQNNTIINCAITLNKANTSTVGIYAANHTLTSTTSLTVTSVSGANNNNKFYSNIISNVNTGVSITGFSDVSPYAFYDQNNEVGTFGTGRSRIFNFASTTTAYGVFATNQNGVKVFNTSIDNQGGAASTSTLYGIYLGTGVNSNVDVYNDTITLVGGGTTGSHYMIYNLMGSSGTNNTVNINNNVIRDCAYPSATSAIVYYIYSSASIYNLNINGNKILNNTYGSSTATATGTHYFIYAAGGATSNNIWNVNNNEISDYTRIQSTMSTGLPYIIWVATSAPTVNMNNNIIRNFNSPGSSVGYGLYASSSNMNVFNCNNNIIKNVTRPNASTGSFYAIYHSAGLAGGTATIANNSISDINIAGSGSIWAIYSSASMNKNIYGDTIYNLNSGGGTVYGIYTLTGLISNVYNNRVTALYTTSSTVYGAFITSGTTNNWYNNMISDLRATTATGTLAVCGFYITGGTTNNLFNNTVYLNAISSSTSSFGTAGIYTSTTPNLDMRNNIIVNVSTPGPTSGFTTAYYRSSTTLSTYLNTSNNNLFFAGTPGTNRLIFYDGTNSIQTLSAYKAFVEPRDNNSVTENPPFVNVSTYPFDVHLSTTVATQCESGGITVSSPISITTDIDNQPRYPNPGYPVHPSYPASAPDIGADEFGGIPLDLLPPSIVYTPLLNTGSTSARTLIATISDPSGVPTTAPGWPHLYWRKGSNPYVGVAPTSVSYPNYTFQFGAGVTVGDTISYYIVARDMKSPTPNIGAFPSAGAGGFTYDPPAASIPPTNPSRYIITQSALAGDYTVGLNMFNSITGRNIRFEKVVKKVLKEVPIDEPQTENIQQKDRNTKTIDSSRVKHQISGKTQLVEVEEISYIPMENGKVYTGDLYVKKSEHPEYNYPAGVMGVYATITAAVADLNLRGVSAYTRFLLVDSAYTTETLPIIVNVTNENLPSASKPVTIKPAAGLSPTIAGSAPSLPVFSIRNSYVSIDGSNTVGGTTRNLTITNTSATSPQVIVIGSLGTTPIVGDTVKNCIIINGANTSSALIVSDALTPGNPGFFNNIIIQNNSFRLSYIACYTNAFVQTGNGSGLRIIGNDFNNLASQVRLVAVYVQGADGAVVTGNNIGNMINTADASNLTGIWFATGAVNCEASLNTIFNINGTSAGPRGIAVSSGVTNSNINLNGNIIDSMYTAATPTTYGIYIFGATGGVMVQKNKISNIKNMNSGGYNAHGIDLSSTLLAANINVQNNFIWDVAAYGYSSITTWNGYGINITQGGGYNIYFNSINLATNQISSSGSPACLIISSSVTTPNCLNIRDNIFSIPATVGVNRYAVLCNATNTVFQDIDYNCYFTSGPNLGYIGGVDRANLSAWRTGTGRDSNSVSGNPQFVSNVDLHINPSVPSPVHNAGKYISTVPDDIDNNPRSTSTPDIGADEYTYVPPPLTGIKNIPGDYPSINAAINELNTAGVGSGGVTFRVSAGYTETIPPCGYQINITNNPPTASNPVVFQKFGTGANPTISSSPSGSATVGTTTLGGNGCAFFELVGTDFITFDGFTLQELYTGADQNLKMQYGFLLVRASSTNGCKNVSILNCNIFMQQSNVSSCGIATLNVDAAHNTTNPTTIDGRHENISIQGCTINNSFNGMYFVGFNASAPYDLYDHFYNIGTTTGNNLINIGSGFASVTNTNTHYGIYALYLDSIRVMNNTVRINTWTNNATNYGIFLSTGINSSADIIGNVVSDTAGGTTTQLSGITCGMGATGTNNVVNIQNNQIRNCNYYNATSGTSYYLYVTSNPFTLNVSNNIIRDNIVGGGASATATGAQYGIWTSSTNSTTGSVYNISSNTVKRLIRTQSAAGAGTTYGIYTSGAGQLTNINGNTVDSIANASTTGTLAGIYYIPAVAEVNVYNNTVSNLAKLTGATTGAIYGIYQSNSSAISRNYNNNIFNIAHNGTTGVIYGYYNFGVGTVAENVYNNTIYNLNSITSGVVVGIFACSGGSPDKEIYGNTVYNLVNTGTGQTGALQVNYADTAKIYKNRFYNIRSNNTASSPAVYGMYLNNSNATVVFFVYNNMIHELYSPVSATGLGVLGIWVNGGLASHLTYNSLYIDSTSTGTNFAAYALYFAGTTVARVRNNIVINKALPTGTGTNLLVYKASTAVYDSILSNNNCWYITPGGNNYYYYDGTTLYPTLSTFKTRVAPAESNSFSEQPPFVNVATSPYDLHMKTTVPTLCESGAQRILSPFPIPDDYDGHVRWGESGYTGSGTAPDVGADEFNGIPSVLTLNLKVYLEGFWNGTTHVVDTVRVYIANSTAPYALVDSQKVVLSTTGNANMNFAKSSGSYYIVIKHRNHLETWSRLPQNFVVGTPLSYDFTTDSAKAFGFNMRKFGSVWVIYAGDLNQDGAVDALDVALFIPQFGNFGYLSGDLNGDGAVDALDVAILVGDFGITKSVPSVMDEQIDDNDKDIIKRRIIDDIIRQFNTPPKEINNNQE